MNTVLAPGIAWPLYGFTPQPKPPKTRRSYKARVAGKTCGEAILSYLSDHPGSSIAMIMQDVNWSENTIASALLRMLPKELVRREQCPTANGFVYLYWRVE